MAAQKFYNLESALLKPIDAIELYYSFQENDNPQRIAELKNLEYLEIRGFSETNFPESIRNLTKLKALIIGGKFRKIPSVVFELSQLKSLTFFYSPINEIPTDIKRLRYLEELKLQSLKIKHLPSGLFSLQSLRILHIENCKIESLSEEIGQLVNLKTLIMNNNQLKSLPNNFALLNLEKLHLGFNPFFDSLGQKQRNIVELLQGFALRNILPEQRKLLFQLFLGNFERAAQIALYPEILEGLNAFNKIIRHNTLAYLYRQTSNPLDTEYKNSLKIHIIGNIKKIKLEEIAEKLNQHQIQLSKKIDNSLSHIFVAENPKAKLKKALESGLPLIAAGHLLDFLYQNENYYLSKDDEASKQMAQNLANLLRSGEEANQQLGLEMIMGGGINPVYYYDLLVLYLWNPNSAIKNMAEKVLEKHLPTDPFFHLKSHCKNYYKDPAEDAINTYLNNLSNEFIDAGQLAIHFYRLTHKGKKFCLNYPESFIEVGRDLLKGAVLSLNTLQLESLNEKIAYFSNTKILYLNQNYLTHLPHSFERLQKLYILNLSKNWFSGFPAQLFAIKQLNTLDLSNNKMKEIPDEIDALERLEILNLKNNQIDILPQSIKNLKKLRILSIAGNPIAKNKEMIEKLKVDLKGCELLY